MSNTSSDKLIQSMYRHLVLAYTSDEARDILLQKYPEAEGDLDDLIAQVNLEDESKTDELLDAVNKKQSKQKVDKPKAVTKMSQAHDIYAKAEDKSRKAMIAAFTDQLGLSKVAASTYYYSVKG